MISVAVVGATGYTGAELMRLLAHHPQMELTKATSRSDEGLSISKFWPALRGEVDLAFTLPDSDSLADCELIFFATPNGTAMHEAPNLLAKGCKLVDLSADFRLRDLAVWSKWYQQDHACPELVAEAVYGLPELFREGIQNANLVANPGCYPTAVVLGLLPLLEEKLIDPKSIIADAKSGVSGAGRGLGLNKLFGEVSGDFKTYAVSGHRHHPEIVQTLSAICDNEIGLTFVPHLLPMFRGMEASIYANFVGTVDNLEKIYRARYVDHPYVDIMSDGSSPQTSSVKGSNYCRIAGFIDQSNGRVVIQSVIDNLVKGAAGQALQNANLMFGLDEQAGLRGVALTP
ncbi:MAG: N-acetyl-gamma-glutamyl-phosphate reductase [Pseudomonadota bacterium]